LLTQEPSGVFTNNQHSGPRLIQDSSIVDLGERQ
jgi:hypothetical protein